MADEVKEQLSSWKEEHPEAVVEQAAPEKPCYTCSLKDPEKRRKLEEIKSVLFNQAYDNLKSEQDTKKIVLITEEQCPPCDEAATILDALIKAGAIEVLPYSKCSPEDKDCIAKQGITVAPVLVSRNTEGKITKYYPLSGPKTAVPLK